MVIRAQVHCSTWFPSTPYFLKKVRCQPAQNSHQAHYAMNSAWGLRWPRANIRKRALWKCAQGIIKFMSPSGQPLGFHFELKRANQHQSQTRTRSKAVSEDVLSLSYIWSFHMRERQSVVFERSLARERGEGPGATRDAASRRLRSETPLEGFSVFLSYERSMCKTDKTSSGAVFERVGWSRYLLVPRKSKTWKWGRGEMGLLRRSMCVARCRLSLKFFVRSRT